MGQLKAGFCLGSRWPKVNSCKCRYSRVCLAPLALVYPVLKGEGVVKVR